MLQQRIPHVHDGAAGGLAPAGHHQGDIRGDLHGAEVVAVYLARAKLGNDVRTQFVALVVVKISGAPASLLHELGHVVLQVLAGLHALLVGLRRPESGHDGVVPVEEVGLRLLGKP
jgi:hypothetical protein